MFPTALLWVGLVTPYVWAQPGRTPPAVVVGKVCKSERSASQTFVGTVTPIRMSTIGSAVDGRVQSVHVEEGDRVELLGDESDAVAGPPLVQLGTETIEIEIDAANVELSIREKALAELQESLPKEIDQFTALVAETDARLQLAQADNQRMRELFESGGGISKKDFDTALSMFQSAKHAQLAATAQLQKLTATREARLGQAAARVQAQREEIRRLEDLKSKYTIRAPFSGYVIAKTTEIGQWVSKGEDVIQLVQSDPIEVTINVPQSIIQQIQQALDASQAAAGSLETAPIDSVTAQVQIDSIAQILTGRVYRIIPQADLRSRSFPVKIRLTNPATTRGHLLKSGMLARVSLAVGDSRPQLFVKKDALVLGGRETRVFVATKEDEEKFIARPVSVETGASYKDWIQVSGALAENDLVVVEGNERLRPGQEIRVIGEIETSFDSIADN